MTDRDNDELRGCRGIFYGFFISLALWCVGFAIYAQIKPQAFSGDPCVCAGKSADSDCQNVRIDIGEGRFATGVTWINDSGKPRSCLRIPPRIDPTG